MQAERSRFWLLPWVLCAFAAQAAAPTLSTENINLSADVLNSDTRNDVHVMSGNVRITQGTMSMEAEQATAKGLQTDHSTWTFERTVHLRTDTADLHSDTAHAVFAAGRIAEATVRGSPATFQQRNAPADRNILGRANVIRYDFAKGTIEMTDNVWFSYGGNEFRGDTVVYNVNEQRVVVNPAGTTTPGGGRVNITIRPGGGIVAPGTKTAPKPTEPSSKKEKNE